MRVWQTIACYLALLACFSPYKIKDTRELKYFLGEVVKSKKRNHLCQRKYALDILNGNGISELASKLCYVRFLIKMHIEYKT